MMSPRPEEIDMGLDFGIRNNEDEIVPMHNWDPINFNKIEDTEGPIEDNEEEMLSE